MEYKLLKLSEPKLMFNMNQPIEDPRDGLTLFGPLDKGKPYGIRAGVVGTKHGIAYFRNWVATIQKPVIDTEASIAWPFFPGFEEAFRIPWNPNPAIEIELDVEEINKVIHLDDPHTRIYKTVDVFTSRIEKSIREEEAVVDVWFIVIPDAVHKYCRPKSVVASNIRIEDKEKLPSKLAKELQKQSSMFPSENERAIPYQYGLDFHNQLKARLIPFGVTTQIIRESTIAFREVLRSNGKPERNLEGMEAAIAWNLTTAAFYKAGGRPWKINEIRDGVCYLGLVFKKNQVSSDPKKNACCGAQMFLDSGDGIVFKGAIGPWYNENSGDFHLNEVAASELMTLAINSYKTFSGGLAPKELFIHGKVSFSNPEWEGFKKAAPTGTNLVGVQIRDFKNLKLFRKKTHPILRGQAFIADNRFTVLWTRGYVPRLQTYPGREVPNPLMVRISKGEADPTVVLRDILALTKLNYNSCKHSDGLPVTLRFADAIGEILTAGPVENIPPLPFRHYV